MKTSWNSLGSKYNVQTIEIKQVYPKNHSTIINFEDEIPVVELVDPSFLVVEAFGPLVDFDYKGNHDNSFTRRNLNGLFH